MNFSKSITNNTFGEYDYLKLQFTTLISLKNEIERNLINIQLFTEGSKICTMQILILAHTTYLQRSPRDMKHIM
jgi:hypothetical protein